MFVYICHQIYAKIACAYYEQNLKPLLENDVSFANITDMGLIISKLTPSQKRCITSVAVHEFQVKYVSWYDGFYMNALGYARTPAKQCPLVSLSALRTILHVNSVEGPTNSSFPPPPVKIFVSGAFGMVTRARHRDVRVVQVDDVEELCRLV
jgi:hypothetical protein